MSLTVGPSVVVVEVVEVGGAGQLNHLPMRRITAGIRESSGIFPDIFSRAIPVPPHHTAEKWRVEGFSWFSPAGTGDEYPALERREGGLIGHNLTLHTINNNNYQ